MEKDVIVSVESPQAGPEAARRHCSWLEEGKIVFFPRTPFEFPDSDRQFLLQQKQTSAQFHKNIAYRPLSDKVTGAAGLSADDSRRLHQIMRRYSNSVQQFLGGFLAPYAGHWRLDYASFRPFQEKGRNLRRRARNDLLHLDNFPTRPTNGDLILRFFTNINPQESRRWITTSSYQELVERFTSRGGLDYPSPLEGWTRLRYSLLKAGKAVGLPVAARPPYDDFMLRLHHAMKEDREFQDTTPKIHLEFPPGSCWMVFTDRVAHAALSGQYALEQTFMVARKSLVDPAQAPLEILQRVSGRAPLSA
ncbi:MAG TPA: Kdo hydroxylase family protein [Acidobacteriota bacterium]|nr:Kdo hydroxylase family protein [Acidobacteriota bacterium]